MIEIGPNETPSTGGRGGSGDFPRNLISNLAPKLEQTRFDRRSKFEWGPAGRQLGAHVNGCLATPASRPVELPLGRPFNGPLDGKWELGLACAILI